MAITFVGDVFLEESIAVPDPLLGRLVLNLEAPITRSSEPVVGKITLRSEANHLLATFGRNILAVNLANNHVMDFGEAGLNDTRAELDAMGVPYFGAGRLSENCMNPLVLDDMGTRIGLAAYVCESTGATLATLETAGVAPFDLERIANDVRRAREAGAQFVAVSVHWGAEEVALPKPSDVARARALADLGIDLVIGHHAHRVQAIETIGDTPVFYGLGNFIMPDLAVPSHFDASGNPTRVFRKRQHFWNRRSLAVTASPENGEVRVEGRWFDGRSVRRMARPRTWSRPQLPDAYYARLFRAAFVGGKLQARLWRYVREPKVPTAAGLRSLLAEFRRREFK